METSIDMKKNNDMDKEIKTADTDNYIYNDKADRESIFNAEYRRRLAHMIHSDIVMLNGQKNELFALALMTGIIGIGGSIFVSPWAMGGCILLIAAAFPMTVFTAEAKCGSGRLFGLLPVNRQDLVRSRFIMVTGLYLAVSAVMYAVMELSLKLGINSDGWKEMLAERGSAMNYESITRLIFLVLFSLGLSAAAHSLRKLFKSSDDLADPMRTNKISRRETILLLSLALTGLFIAFATAAGLAVSAALSLGVQLIMQLAQAADGFLLGAVILTCCIFDAAYMYICAAIEYDGKEI